MWRFTAAAFVAAACLTLSTGFAFADEYACGPDYNGDGVSNEVDAEIFEAAFGSEIGEPEYLPAADHNGDGTVGVGDSFVFSGCAAD